MPESPNIHDILASLEPSVLAALDGIDFWDIEGEYDAIEKITELKASPGWKAYQKESKEKNSRIWDIVKVVLVGGAINAGLRQVNRDYWPQIQRQAAKEKAKGVAPARPTARDYANQYIKERGGEFITNMNRTDQQKLVNFIWSNAGEHERPLKAMINKQSHLRYVLDQGRHREETIVRTEKARATAYGAHYYARDWGAKTKTRHSAFRPTSRPSHTAISGEEVQINKPYSNGEMYCKENSINCLCWDTFNF